MLCSDGGVGVIALSTDNSAQKLVVKAQKSIKYIYKDRH